MSERPPDVPPNAASRALDRLEQLSWAHDWEGVRAAAAEDFVWDDRRPLTRLSGDIQLLIKNMEVTRPEEQQVRHDRRLIATVGDRIAVHEVVWSATSEDRDFLIELLTVCEVDANGLLLADVVFDADGRDDAFNEARARFAVGEGANVDDATGAALEAFGRGVHDHDWNTARRALADGFRVRDHQAIGLLNVDGADAWIDTYRSMTEQAPDWGGETYRTLAWDQHGCVIALRQFGTLTDGGPFERKFLCVFYVRVGLIRRLELFDLAAEDRALARFEELRSSRD